MVATPAEIRERIQAERRGTPFLVYRDGDDRQVIVDLPTLLRPAPTRLRVALARLSGLAQVLILYRAQRRRGERDVQR